MCFLPRDDILKQLKFAQEKEDGKLRMDLEQTKKFKVNDLVNSSKSNQPSAITNPI